MDMVYTLEFDLLQIYYVVTVSHLILQNDILEDSSAAVVERVE